MRQGLDRAAKFKPENSSRKGLGLVGAVGLQNNTVGRSFAVRRNRR
jgi:hypothetical protein